MNETNTPGGPRLEHQLRRFRRYLTRFAHDMNRHDRMHRPYGDGGPEFDLHAYARSVHCMRGRK